ncbi:MAG TPA: response regulator [Candidatus Thermoplasmatota archaeon]|nr:response regulator [Candidatus Thermoplasmatota archaeon]
MTSAPAPPGAPAQAPLRALVVDDIPEICNMYRALFRRIRGIDVELTVETDPAAAIARLSETAYDLVVSDFRMKGADGIDVLRAARERNPAGRRVLMTGYNEIPASIQRIREARIDAYLQKPLRTQELLVLISDLLRGDERALAAYREHAGELELVAQREELGGRAT